MQEEVNQPLEEKPFEVDQLAENARTTFEFLAEYKKIKFICECKMGYN